MDTVRDETLETLGRLDQAKFQRLGDIILPQLHVDLTGLVAQGVNYRDKTTKGVPDSYIGPSPQDCTIAVEYNTWEGQLKKKLSGDYKSVKSNCAQAKVVVLVCSAPLGTTDTTTLRRLAKADSVELRLIDGVVLARFLDRKRQDLRHTFLNIAIDTHTKASLVARLASLVADRVLEGAWEDARDNLISRKCLDRAVMARLSQNRPEVTVVLGGVGTGKSIWAMAVSQRLADVSPTVLFRAKDLNYNADDPLSSMIVHLAQGASSGERIIKLGDLLRRESLALNAIIDGVDEAPSYQAIEKALRVFRSSALAPRSHLILMVRRESWSTLRRYIVAAWPSMERRAESSVLHINDLEQREAQDWLSREGVTPAETRVLLGHLPKEFSGRPLFLLRGLSLLRGGKLSREAPFSTALADDFLERLSRTEPGNAQVLSRSHMRRCLGRLAWSCMVAPAESTSRAELETDDTLWIDDSEHGFLARCRRVGLLVERRPEQVSFTHSLYQAAFAAVLMCGETPQRWTESVGALPAWSRRARLVSIAPYLHTLDGLFDALMEIDVGLALECASQAPEALSPTRHATALANLGELLDSRFPSDRRSGLRLLSGMRGAGARGFAVSRFNALPPKDKHIWAPEWAEVFLRLEEPGAMQVILRHWQLRSGPDFTWFEPEFVQSLEMLSSDFRGILADQAYRAVADAGKHIPSAETLLAMLRDQRIVELLRDRLGARPLNHLEHRLLIHLNTSESLEVYVESAQRWIDRMVELRDSGVSGVGDERYSILCTIVVKQTDVAMYPHDSLVEVVEACLGASLREIAWMGLEWAETLGHPSLLVPWASRPSSFFSPFSSFVENVVRNYGPEIARPHMTAEAPQVLRRALSLYLRHCPSRAAVDMLLEALDWEDARDTAITSLGHLRVVRAVPKLCSLLPASGGWSRHALIRALGEIGHDSCVGPLVGWLLGLAPSQKGESHEAVCQALAAIGGAVATEELRKLLPDSNNEGRVVATLLARADDDGLDLLFSRLCGAPALLQGAIDVLGEWSLERYLPQASYKPDTLLRASIGHSGVCKLLLEACSRDFDILGRWQTTQNPLRTAGRLDYAPAREWLRTVAEAASEWGAEDEHHRVDAPTCAREALSELGMEPFLSQRVDRCLDSVLSQKRSFISTHRLDRWPRRCVRERIVNRVMRGPVSPHLAWLLSHYAEPEDAPLLHELEKAEDLRVADIVHQRIRWEGFVERNEGNEGLLRPI